MTTDHTTRAALDLQAALLDAIPALIFGPVAAVACAMFAVLAVAALASRF